MDNQNINYKDVLNLFPLRIAITDYCNLKCFFCSNEGMPLNQKNLKHADINKLKYLVSSLAEKGLKNISITGGDPTLHPNACELMEYLGEHDFKDVFFHTNGVGLNDNLIKVLSGVCNKIAVSMHAAKFDTWQKITHGTEAQFKALMDNLEKLYEVSKNNDALTIEIKYVPIKGSNDSEKDIYDFLELCNKYRFKFKFLNFEPIVSEHIGLSMSLKEVMDKLVNIGCAPMKSDMKFRGQSCYLPIEKFSYKNTWGVAIEIGCGEPEVCRDCFKSNEIFINPDFNIKPCHMNDSEIKLVDHIINRDVDGVVRAIVDSRNFLAELPGVNSKVWQNNNK